METYPPTTGTSPTGKTQEVSNSIGDITLKNT
jgi:hypothetical protein